MRVSRYIGIVGCILLGCCLCLCSRDKQPPIFQPIPADPVDSNWTGWTIYRIDSGQHFSQQSQFTPFRSDTLEFKVVFDSTARYFNRDTVNQLDWNKVLGFSDCGTHHQQNSLRLGWRYAPSIDKIELAWYGYREGLREFFLIGSMSLNDTASVGLYRDSSNYQLKLGSASFNKERKCQNTIASYWLFPYFGGDETAPQNIRVYVRHLYPEDPSP